MIRKIHSKCYPAQLLASVVSSAGQGREDAADAKEILQVSRLNLPQGKTIASHRHLPQVRTTHGTSEAWIVIAGTLSAQVFDFDHSVATTVDLGPGDCMVLYQGGHNFTVVSPDAVIYEVKNGPYNGPAADSEKIE